MRQYIPTPDSVGTWEGADWPHEYREDDDPQDLRYCEGDIPGCPVCAAAKEDAKAAAELASRAAGFLREAFTLLEQAARVERAWGDDPTYGPILKAVEAIQEALEVVLEPWEGEFQD